MAVSRRVVCDGVVELEEKKGKLWSVRINYVLANVCAEQKEEGETVRLELGKGGLDNGIKSLHKKSVGGSHGAAHYMGELMEPSTATNFNKNILQSMPFPNF